MLPGRDRRILVAALIAVWFVWGFVSLAATIHFHGVTHAVDPETDEVIHLHAPVCCFHDGGRGEDGHAATTGVPQVRSHRDHAGERETCPFLSAVQHTSSVLCAVPSMATSFHAVWPISDLPGAHGEQSIALLALAPKLPPPSLL